MLEIFTETVDLSVDYWLLETERDVGEQIPKHDYVEGMSSNLPHMSEASMVSYCLCWKNLNSGIWQFKTWRNDKAKENTNLRWLVYTIDCMLVGILHYIS